MARETRKGPKTGNCGKRTMKEYFKRSTSGSPRRLKRNQGRTGASYDWRKYPKKYWPYTGLDDPKYIKDKHDLIEKHGNGWYWFQGTPEFVDFKRNREKILNED
jgi:hypothetical protein